MINEMEFRAGFADAYARQPMRSWGRTDSYVDGYDKGDRDRPFPFADANAALFEMACDADWRGQ